jgi:hypothetical protein
MSQLMGASGQALGLNLGKDSRKRGYDKGKTYVRAEIRSDTNDVLVCFASLLARLFLSITCFDCFFYSMSSFAALNSTTKMACSG